MTSTKWRIQKNVVWKKNKNGMVNSLILLECYLMIQINVQIVSTKWLVFSTSFLCLGILTLEKLNWNKLKHFKAIK